MFQISVVIPLKDEEKSLPILYEELVKVLEDLKKTYEIIFIDDGSTDSSYEVLTSLAKKDKHIKIIKFRANFGKSDALSAGFGEAKGEIIVILDADLQDDPAEIPHLLEKIEKEGYDLVSGWRKDRKDRLTKKVSSFLYNNGTSFVSGLKMHDFNCGLKAMKKEVAKELYLRGELHRFIPVLAYKKKFRVGEVVVKHRARQFGVSKYGSLGIQRGWKGTVDLLTTIFVSDYAAKPAHFFGGIGLALFVAGFFMDAYVTYIKITTGNTQGRIPLLLAGILLILLGVQLISVGLIAEMLSDYFAQREFRKLTN